MKHKKQLLQLNAISLLFYALVFLGLDYINFIDHLNSIGDSIAYKESSRILFQEGKIHPFRPLGISFITGLPYLLALSKYYVLINWVLNLLMWLGTIFVIYKTLTLKMGPQKSVFLSLVFVLSLGNIVLTGIVLSETSTTLLLAIFCHQLLKYSISKNYKYIINLAAVLILLTLIRPGFYYPAIAISIYGFWLIIKNKIPIRNRALMFIACFLLILNNSLMFKNYGTFKPSNIDSITLYTYLGAYSQTEVRNTSTARIQRERRDKINKMNYPEIGKLAKEDFVFQMSYHPFVVIRYYIRNILWNSSDGTTTIITSFNKSNSLTKQFLFKLSQSYNILFTLIAVILPFLVFGTKRKIDLFWILSTLLVWYIICSSGISYRQGDRFHIVFYPIVLTQICYFLSNQRARIIA